MQLYINSTHTITNYYTEDTRQTHIGVRGEKKKNKVVICEIGAAHFFGVLLYKNYSQTLIFFSVPDLQVLLERRYWKL